MQIIGRQLDVRGGFSLVEVTIAMTVLLVTMLAMTLALVNTTSLNQFDRERRLAENALRARVEEISALSDSLREDPGGWSQAVLARFAPGGNPGSAFNVPGLATGNAAPTTGTIQVIVDETLSDQDIGIDLGMPRDLDGDGLTSNANVSATAGLLPIVVRVQWTGKAGQRQVSQGFYILGY